MEGHTGAESELVGEPIRTLGPGFGQARRQEIARHGFEQSIMHGIQKHERGNNARGLRRIEPCRCQRHVHTDGHLPAGLGCSMCHTPGPSPCYQAGSPPYGAMQELASGQAPHPVRGLVHHEIPPTEQRTSVSHPLLAGEGIRAPLRTSIAHLHRGPSRYGRESVPILIPPPVAR